MNLPLLDHNLAPEAITEPGGHIQPRDVPEHCVICFFHDVLDKVISEHNATMIERRKWEDGPHPLYEIDYDGRRLAFYHPGVGAPISAGLLEVSIAYGCRKFIACGGCGVLEAGITLGDLIVENAAVRDEGVSYAYAEPSREIAADPDGVDALVRTLEERNIPHRVAKTWTPPAPYRETRKLVDQRVGEGCLTVEMEAAAMIAVARYRKVTFGQVLYGGDDLSGDEWDVRGWQSKEDVRENLFWLAADAVLHL